MKIKTWTIALAVCVIPVAIFGQQQTQINVLRGEMSSFMTSGLFYRQLSTRPPASLVLFDTKDKDWEKDFAQIRREDPFAVYNLNFVSFTIDQGVGDELREKEGWPKGAPRWAIYDTKGQCVANGATLPTSAQLADACSSAGIRSRVDIYRRFLREHPNHEQARMTLLTEMANVAEKRTRYALQVPESSTMSNISFSATSSGGIGVNVQGQQDPSLEQIESLPELTAEADERIWRDYCIEFQKYLEGAIWQVEESPLRPIVRLDSKQVVSSWAIFSPLARAAYKKAAVTVEAALARQPSSTTIWTLWATLNKTGAGSSMKELLETLEPSPTIARTNWPPSSVMAEYMKSCRQSGDWKTIMDLVKPSWDLLSMLVNRSGQRGGSDTSSQTPQVTMRIVGPDGVQVESHPFLNQGFWTSQGEAYLEALLRQQRLADAEQMMKTWASSQGWTGAFPLAAAIAEKLGYESLAKSWRELGNRKQ
ncbi:MAG: hypothetical protein LBC63_05615 [Holophagales bacterium]|nr:hypothetical protein [Holophagales bacterium]